MSEADWDLVLKVFRAVLPRRGDKGRDDRKFLEALHYFTVHNITWRALPTEFGAWNTVWKRFWRLSQSGVFEPCSRRSPRQLVRSSGTDVRLHDRSRPRLGSGRQRGQDGQALGRSRGGFSTKIHLKTDFAGLPIAFDLLQARPVTAAIFRSCSTSDRRSRRAPPWATRATTARSTAAETRSRGICPVIPVKTTAKDRPAFFPKALYRARARIEQCVGKLKRFKRIALRCEKTARNYGSFVAFGLTMILIKSVHRA